MACQGFFIELDAVGQMDWWRALMGPQIRMVLQSLPRWTYIVWRPLIAQGGDISTQHVIVFSLIIRLLTLHLRWRYESLPPMIIIWWLLTRIHRHLLPQRINVRQQFPIYNWLTVGRRSFLPLLLLFYLHGFDKCLNILRLENARIFVRYYHLLCLVCINLLVKITRIIKLFNIFPSIPSLLLPLPRLLALLCVFGILKDARLLILLLPLLRLGLVLPLHFLFAVRTGVVRHYNILLKIIW